MSPYILNLARGQKATLTFKGIYADLPVDEYVPMLHAYAMGPLLGSDSTLDYTITMLPKDPKDSVCIHDTVIVQCTALLTTSFEQSAYNPEIIEIGIPLKDTLWEIAEPPERPLPTEGRFATKMAVAERTPVFKVEPSARKSRCKRFFTSISSVLITTTLDVAEISLTFHLTVSRDSKYENNLLVHVNISFFGEITSDFC